MKLERRLAAEPGAPFPIHEDLPVRLLAAHATAADRDPLVAHVLGTLAAYAYADTETMATMAARLGLEGSGCVGIAQTVDAMLVFSTAYVLQSACGRVGIVCYRGTEAATFGNWLGDADVGSERMTLGEASFVVHAGFRRNMRATRWVVLEQLRLALEGRSVLAPGERVGSPLEALYVTGHSLGGAMAVLFALSLDGEHEQRELLAGLRAKLRAVYTFGQPLFGGEPFPPAAGNLAQRVYRHVIPQDPIPALPPALWGRLTHLGKEYRWEAGEWRRAETPVVQLANLREVPRSLLAFFARAERRERLAYAMAAHAPHHYLAALRPPGCVTELGDRQ
jgi:lipase (class 3)